MQSKEYYLVPRHILEQLIGDSFELDALFMWRSG